MTKYIVKIQQTDIKSLWKTQCTTMGMQIDNETCLCTP